MKINENYVIVVVVVVALFVIYLLVPKPQPSTKLLEENAMLKERLHLSDSLLTIAKAKAVGDSTALAAAQADLSKMYQDTNKIHVKYIPAHAAVHSFSADQLARSIGSRLPKGDTAR